MIRSGVLAAVAMLGLAAIAAGPAVAKKQREVITATGTVDTAGVPEFGTVRSTATCPKKTKLVGGGYAGEADGDGGLVPLESHATGKRGWLVTAMKGGSGDRTLDAHAYCRKGAPRLRESSVGVTVPGGSAVGAGPEAAATATCSKKAKAVAGGFALSPRPTASGEIVPPVPLSSKRSGKRTWTASAQVPVGEQAVPLTAYAYCSRKKRLETTASAEVPVGPLASVLSPACSKGTSLSGGFSSPPLSGLSFVVPVASLRSGDQWVTRGFPGEGGGTVTTYAYCG